MRKCWLLAAVAVLWTLAGSAQESRDPVTGTWASDGLTYFELTLESGTRVSGTVIWRDGGRFVHRAAIRTGSFDPKTGALELEGRGMKPDGSPVDYTIKGKITNDLVSGTYRIGTDSGDFTFTRRSPASTPQADTRDTLVSGTWTGFMHREDGSQREPITVTLNFDGKTVSGRITGPASPGEISGGSFDPDTGALKLPIVVQDENKTAALFEGTVSGQTATGRVSIGGRVQGVFTITKKDG